MRTLARTFAAGTIVCLFMACALVGVLADRAWATASVTISPGDPHSQQTITVSGAGFPVHAKDPTGIQILECADPGGTTAGLPASNLLCDGTTINPTQINTDAQGSFTARYTVYALSGLHTSNIYCDKTHFCVLWAGVDYNGNFLGVHAFSAAFEVGGTGSTTTGGGSGTTIWVPIVVVVVVAGALLVVLARRRQSTSPSSSS